MATWAARSRVVRRWRALGGVILLAAGLRFVARPDGVGGFVLAQGDRVVGTCASLDECEARAFDVARERGLL